jgi:hypothetical protein
VEVQPEAGLTMQHPVRTMMEACFEQGVTVQLAVSTPLLRRMGNLGGFPGHVLDMHPDAVPLILGPAKFIPYYGVEFFDDHVELTLSFDDLYRVQVPYGILHGAAIILSPEDDWREDYSPSLLPNGPWTPAEDEQPQPTLPSQRPTLRLIRSDDAAD